MNAFTKIFGSPSLKFLGANIRKGNKEINFIIEQKLKIIPERIKVTVDKYYYHQTKEGVWRYP